ncbi:hypothetical protein AB7M45_007813 [Bradyrhizobium elkanii]|uniref:phage head-tail connector protein n=2 Tax=Bradyrhizobium elkanii TaxID=29448 RepID=UPI000914EBB5|nr:phage head-tail connector protein [Bradyrhizobium elkanii]MCW2195040.1 hypothetical protein [Bradyrhizobium elkanii]NWL67265.1 phage head-tail connector protein [Bradyrhizobium elkanii]OIM91628.1 hypothetical protein BLN97_26515 [Bradyrhizobium elkanii]
MFTVATPAATKALTTLEAVKADLGISGSAEDAYLTEKINQASAAVCAYLRVPQASDGSMTLASEELVQTFRFEDHGIRRFSGVGAANPRRHLILARRPVTAVASVVVGDTALQEADFEIDGAAGLLSRLRNDRVSSWHGCHKVVVSFTAGYRLQDAGNDRTLPYDIEKAVIDLVKGARSARKRDPLLKEIEVVDVDRKVFWVGGTPGSSTLPPEIAATLDQWRYVALAA